MLDRHFLVPGALTRRTGGSIYDRRIVEGLSARGAAVTVHELDEDYPFPALDSLRRLADCLAAVPNGATVVIDGLIAGCVPEVLAREAARLRVVSLLHHPLADETGLDDDAVERFRALEGAALSHVAGVIVTSGFTRHRLDELFGLDGERVYVVPPGTDSKPRAVGGGGASISMLCVASVTPRKGHLVLLEALAALSHLSWRLICVGSQSLDPMHVALVTDKITALGLEDRVSLISDVSPEDLDTFYRHADLFVLPSYYEGFGMVITEAVAHGLPVITTTGGALRDTAPDDAAMLVPPGDSAALSDGIRRVVEDRGLRLRLADGARRERQRLPAWDDTVAAFEDALRGIEGDVGI